MSSENTNKQKASKLKLGIILGSSIIVVLGVVLFFIFMQKNSVVGKYLPKVGNAANTIAIAAIVTAVLMIVAAIVIKKKLSQKDGLFTTADAFTSNQMETANVNEALDNTSDDITM